MIEWINTVPLTPAEWLADAARRLKKVKWDGMMTNRQHLIDIYSGDNVSGHLKDKFTEDLLAETRLAEQNIVDRVIRRIALVFKKQPKWGFEEGAVLPDGYSLARRWKALKGAERLANLVGTVAIRPAIRNGRMDWETIWYFIPIFGDDPLTPEAIIYPTSTAVSDVTVVENVPWIYWSKDRHFKFFPGENTAKRPTDDNGDMVNPLNDIPFVFVHPRLQVGDEFWTTGYGGPIADANDAMNVGLTEIRLGIRFNLMGQYYLTGVDEKTAKTIKSGVGNIWVLPDLATAGVANPQSNVEGAIKAIRNDIEISLQNVGIQVQWGETADQPSGESLKIKAFELLERREDDVAVWSSADRDLAVIEQDVWDKDKETSGTIPNLLTVDYEEVALPTADAERRDRIDWEAKRGLTNYAEQLVKTDPDGFADPDGRLTPVEVAQEQIKKNLTLNRETPSPRAAFVAKPDAKPLP